MCASKPAEVSSSLSFNLSLSGQTCWPTIRHVFNLYYQALSKATEQNKKRFQAKNVCSENWQTSEGVHFFLVLFFYTSCLCRAYANSCCNTLCQQFAVIHGDLRCYLVQVLIGKIRNKQWTPTTLIALTFNWPRPQHWVTPIASESKIYK